MRSCVNRLKANWVGVDSNTKQTFASKLTFPISSFSFIEIMTKEE